MINKFMTTFLMGLSCTPAFAQFQTADLLQITATPTITFDVSSGTFTYQYVLSSSSSSVQVLQGLDLVTQDKSVDDGGTIRTVRYPTNPIWNGGASFSSNIGAYTIDWYPAAKIKSLDDTYSPPVGALKPGQTLGGFSFFSSYLPQPTTFYAQGWVMPVNQGQLMDRINQQLGTNYDSIDQVPGNLVRQVYPAWRSIPDNSFHGVTIGPMSAPTSLSNSDLTSRLISLKHQAVSLGWIFGQGASGIVQSLDAKLSAAKKAIAAGDKKTAANELGAFISELQAQRGKHLNDNAFFLLQANAQFIISKL